MPPIQPSSRVRHSRPRPGYPAAVEITGAGWFGLDRLPDRLVPFEAGAAGAVAGSPSPFDWALAIPPSGTTGRGCQRDERLDRATTGETGT